MKIEPLTDEELKEEWEKNGGISRTINKVAQKVNEILKDKKF